MRSKARLAQHPRTVSADRYDPACFEGMMFVEGEAVRLVGNSAPIDYGLAIVLAGRLKNGKLEQPVGGRVEFRFADPLRQTIVSQVKWAVLHKAGIGKAVAQGEPQEVVPVERAAQERKSVEMGTGGADRLEPGGRRSIKK